MTFKKIKFELTEDHIKLLRKLSITWYDDEWGAPGAYSKKPYGNSDVHRDMAKILGLSFKGNDENNPYGKKQTALMDQLHKELETALEIVLVTGDFQPGVYEHREYHHDWKLVELHSKTPTNDNKVVILSEKEWIALLDLLCEEHVVEYENAGKFYQKIGKQVIGRDDF